MLANMIRYRYTCGAKNLTQPGYCDRPVAGPGQRCWDRRHQMGLAPPRRWPPATARLQQPSTVPKPRPPSTPQQRPNASSGQRPTKAKELKIPDKAVEVLHDVVTEGWKSAVADQISTVLNNEFWNSLPRRQQRKRPNCQALADIVDGMQLALKLTHSLVATLAGKGVDWLGRSSLERRVIEEFARKIPLPGEDQIKETIRTIRVFGVFLCYSAGLNVATECPCFRPLWSTSTKEALKKALEQKLDILVSNSGPPLTFR